MSEGGRRSGARSMQSHLNAPINEPTIVLLDIGLLLRADPNEQGADLLSTLADLFGRQP